METITVTLNKDWFERCIDLYNLVANVDYTIKDVKVKDELFVGDELHKAYKKKADKAYKELQEYEFKKRNA